MIDLTYPSDRLAKFVLRLPDGMRDRIKAAAEANNRSMNAEIVATLEEKYPEPVPEAGPSLSDLYELMNYVQSATTDAEQQKRLEVANGKLSQTGHGVTLRLSRDRISSGPRIVYMAIDDR